MIRGIKAHVPHAFRAYYYKMIDKKIKTFNALINNSLARTVENLENSIDLRKKLFLPFSEMLDFPDLE